MNILITGATKGIGRAIALKMASLKFNMALCARSYDDLLSLKKQLRHIHPDSKIFIKAVDCGVKEDVLAFADEVLQELGFIDVLINNVGVFYPSPILEEDDDALLKQMNVNVFAAYYLYKKLGIAMRDAQKGIIINICSVASKESIVNAGSYCVTKAALLSLNHIMRNELKVFGVKVTAILPGSTLTASWGDTEIPKDTFVQPEDVAEIVNKVIDLSKGANIDEITVQPLNFTGN